MPALYGDRRIVYSTLSINYTYPIGGSWVDLDVKINEDSVDLFLFNILIRQYKRGEIICFFEQREHIGLTVTLYDEFEQALSKIKNK